MAPGIPPPIAFFNAFWNISFPDFVAIAAVGASPECTLAIGFILVLLLRREDLASSNDSTLSDVTLIIVALIEQHVFSTQASSNTTIKSESGLMASGRERVENLGIDVPYQSPLGKSHRHQK